MGLHYKRLKQTGDTIVEVMIAAAIVSLVLTGAYAAANKSLQQIRASQERSEANKVAAAAMERLNSAVDTNKWLITNGSVNAFCIKPDGSVQDATSPASNTLAGAVARPYQAACLAGTGYKTYILREGGAGTKRFSVYVIWDNASGGKEQVLFSYFTSAT